MPILSGDVLAPNNLNERQQTNKIIADSSTFTTTEISIATVTATLTTGLTYRVWAAARWSTTAPVYTYAAANIEVVLMRIREDSGIVGNELNIGQMPMFNSSSVGHGPLWVYGEYVPSATGSKTFSLTGQRASGAGTYQLRATSARPAWLCVELVI